MSNPRTSILVQAILACIQLRKLAQQEKEKNGSEKEVPKASSVCAEDTKNCGEKPP